MSEAIMEKLIRNGQTSGTFKWATAPEQHTALAFHKNFTRTPTDQQLKAKCERAVKSLADNEEDAEAAGDEEDAAGAAPSKTDAGLQMPGEDKHTTPKPKAKSKVRAGSRGTRSDFDTPPAKKPRQGRLEVAVAEGLIGAPKGMALSCGAGSSQCLAAASSRDTSAAAPDVVGAASPAKTQGQWPGQGHHLNLAGALTGKLQRQVFERGEKHCVYIGRGHD